MLPIKRADRDKPHRCPDCWTCLTWGEKFRKYKIYTCNECEIHVTWFVPRFLVTIRTYGLRVWLYYVWYYWFLWMPERIKRRYFYKEDEETCG